MSDNPNDGGLALSLIDQITEALRSVLRDENQMLKNRIELLESANSDVARIAKERDDSLERVKRLEQIIERASTAFFYDGSDKSTATNMLIILKESKP
jgi:hypothetical protein